MSTAPAEVKTKLEESAIIRDAVPLAFSSTATASAASPSSQPEKTHQPPLIVFGIMDLKLDMNGEVKILEFGAGQTSVLMNQAESYTKVAQIIKEHTGLASYTFQKIIQSATNTNSLTLMSKPLTRFSDYTSVHEPDYGNFNTSLQNSRVLLQNNSPTWALATVNKIFMHELFSQSKQLNCRPKCQFYGSKFNNALHKDIETHFPTTPTFVLKAPCSTRGEGVFIVPRNELSLVLPALLASADKLEEALLQYKTALEKHKSPKEIEEDMACIRKWNKEVKKFSDFMVEEYCSSQSFTMNEACYDATIRAEFLILIEEGNVQFHDINCYWNPPRNPINEGSLRGRALSDVRFYPMDKANYTTVFSQIKPILEGFFKHLYNFDISSYILSLDERLPFTFNGGKNKSFMLLYQYANILLNYSLCEQIIQLFEDKSFNARIANLNNALSKAQILAMAGMAYFLNVYHQELTQKETLYHLSQAYQHIEGAIVMLPGNSGGVYDRLIAEYYLKWSIIEADMMSFPKVKAAIENLSADAIKHKQKAFEIEKAMRLPKEAEFLANCEKQLMAKLLERKILLAQRKQQGPILLFGDQALKANLHTQTTLDSTPQRPTPSSDGHRSLVDDWKAHRHEVGPLYLLVEKLIEGEQYNKALRNIAVCSKHDCAFNAAKLLLKYQKELRIDIDELAESLKPEMQRSALHHAAAAGNEYLYVLLKEQYKADAQKKDGNNQTAEDLMLEYIKRSEEYLKSKNAFLI